MSATKTALVVLGMHRSGTSSVAGALSLLGAAPPRTLMTPGDDNPRGFWESLVLMQVNDGILARGGSDWRDWRPFRPDPAVMAASWDEAAQSLAAEFGGQSPIVLKDPRICRFFPFWRDVLEASDYQARVVSPIRDPRETAGSLTARNAMSREAALRLWLRHVLEAEAASRDLKRRVLLWRDFLEDWRGEAARLEVRLDMSLNLDDAERGAAVDAFLSADLQRQRGDDQPVPRAVAETYDLLCELAHDGEHPGVHRRLDEIRTAFDADADLFADAPR